MRYKLKCDSITKDAEGYTTIRMSAADNTGYLNKIFAQYTPTANFEIRTLTPDPELKVGNEFYLVFEKTDAR